jgi:hypothetical protein
MTVFSPRDHKGVILNRQGDEPATSRRGRQFTVGHMMKAVLIIAVGLAIAAQRPDLLSLPGLFIFAIIAVCLYGLSWFPYRIRLTIELLTACYLLTLAAWVWRPPFYVYQPERHEELARLCSLLADKTDDERLRDLFHREAAEYRRRARVLRFQGMWYGLIRSVTKEEPWAFRDRELILELGLLEALERHERIGEQMGIPGIHRRP